MMSFSRPQQVQGFSMIEVLIAVLILAIGLLGVAALQMASMNSGQEGYFRTQATALAEDYISRIKSSRQAMLKLRDGDGDLVWDSEGPLEAARQHFARYVANPLACNQPNDICRPSGADGAALCSAAEMIAFEQWDMCQQAQTLLPGGTVHVVQAEDSLRLSVAVAWLATQARDDTSEEAVVVNPVCATDFAIPATMDCIVVEAIP